jgi:plastocyanin
MMNKVLILPALIRFFWIPFILFTITVISNGQVSHTVEVTNFVFTPSELTVNAGDTVIWNNTEGSHNVDGTQAVYPDNPESFGNDVGAGWVFSHVFTIPGTYDYQCDPHAQYGMVGQVTVQGTAASIPGSPDTDHLGTGLQLFPNPATDQLQIRAADIIESVSVYTITGKMLDEISGIGSGVLQIPLEGIRSGIYIIEARTESGIRQTARFTKE